ncbi:WAP four-disulfide core domain protein 2 [Microcaecilia unicolor]|uniref:WAP four-disulfide core domain protein 2-like n=1 Tax=Microcaecilia unicolor TaxID=1415580 RepID=A0A6P7Z5A7_9AMPH|nr:WAP four-disulfide core domain protein 2-like [Microcaecilia unicolor]
MKTSGGAFLFVVFLTLWTALQSENPGMCPVPNEYGLGRCSTACTHDIQCSKDKKCCKTACGGTACRKPFFPNRSEKPGRCPDPDEYGELGFGICEEMCIQDTECSGDLKCCKTACGVTSCLKPQTFPNRPASNRGRCPYNWKPCRTPFFPSVSQCQGDWQCQMNQKCCSVGCDKQCVNIWAGLPIEY